MFGLFRPCSACFGLRPPGTPRPSAGLPWVHCRGHPDSSRKLIGPRPLGGGRPKQAEAGSNRPNSPARRTVFPKGGFGLFRPTSACFGLRPPGTPRPLTAEGTLIRHGNLLAKNVPSVRRRGIPRPAAGRVRQRKPPGRILGRPRNPAPGDSAPPPAARLPKERHGGGVRRKPQRRRGGPGGCVWISHPRGSATHRRGGTHRRRPRARSKPIYSTSTTTRAETHS